MKIYVSKNIIVNKKTNRLIQFNLIHNLTIIKIKIMIPRFISYSVHSFDTLLFKFIRSNNLNHT